MNYISLLGLILILPIMVYAQTTDDTSTVPNNSIESTNNTIGPTGIVDELQRGHSIITDIMIDQSNDIFKVTDDIIFTLTFIDYEKNELVVGVDPILYELDIKPTVQEIQDITGDIPIKLYFAYVTPDTHNAPNPTKIERLLNIWDNRCDSSSTSKICKNTSNNLKNKFHYRYDSTNNMWLLPLFEPKGRNTIQIPTTDAGGIIFSDDFENLDKWYHVTNKQFKSKIGDTTTYKESWSNTNKIAESTKCGNECSMILFNNINMTGYSFASLTLDYYLNNLITNNALKIELYNDNTWNTILESSGTNNTWVSKVFPLNDYLNTTHFSIRITADTNNNKKVGIDNIKIIAVNSTDTTPPRIISQSDNLVGLVNGNSGVFYYSILAKDIRDGFINIQCNPPSGSVFNVGTTNISCTATDKSGNSKIITDTVTITSQSEPIRYYGGDANKYFYYDVHSNEFMRDEGGTIGIGATTKNGIKGIVVSGHVVKPIKNTIQLQHVMNNSITEHIIYSGNVSYQRSNNTDAGFIPIKTNTAIIDKQVKSRDGTIHNVIDGKLSDLDRLSKITIHGQFNNGDGLLLFKNATVYKTDLTLSNMGIATYPRQSGDSGASIIYHNNNTSKIVGIHQGIVCILEDLSAGQGLINITHITSICQTSPYYKTFSAWENVKSALNLQ